MKTFPTYRRFLAVIAFIITSVSTTWAFVVDGMSYQKINSTEVKLTKGLNQAEVVIPQTVTYNGVTYTVVEIAQSAFQSFNNTRHVTIPYSVRTVSRQAFYDNYYLEEVEFNEGLETIGASAFAFNYALKEITIPSTVVKIDDSAFYTNRSAEIDIYCWTINIPEIASTSFYGRTQYATLHVYASDLEIYKTTDYWKDFIKIEGISNGSGVERCNYPTLSYNNYKLSMTTETEGATIYYTTDGSMPDETSIQYTSPISYNSNIPIRAIAIKEGMLYSAIRSFNLRKDMFKTEATFDATLSEDLTMTINCDAISISEAPDVETWYRNETYKTEWEEYVSPIKLQRPGIYHVYAKREGWVPTIEKTYDFYTNYYTDAPTITWNKEEGKVSITHSDPDVDIYYTLDGTDPSVETSLYSEPITITKNTEIKAIAAKREKFDSDIISYKVSDIVNRFYVNGIYYQLTGNMIDEVQVDDGKNASGNVVIPEKVTFSGQVFHVIDIATQAFKDNKQIKSVSLPNSITYINNSTFENCSLKEIDIPGSVETIGNRAFFASGLEKITFHEGLLHIGDEAFAQGAKNSYSSRYDDKPLNCEIIFPNSLLTIGECAFKANTKVPKIIIPEGVVSIGANAFEACYSITHIELPNSLQSLKGLFHGCWGLRTVKLPSNLGQMGNVMLGGFFDDCRSLVSVDIPEGVTIISEGMFRGCESLTSISLPLSITEIQKEAFQGCKKLQSILLPENVSILGKDAFSRCSSLKSVYSESPAPPNMNNGMAFPEMLNQVTIYVKRNSLQNYKEANYWAEINDIRVIEQIPCVTPSFVFTEDYTLVIQSQTEGATIYYTTDGSEPSNLSQKYTAPIPVNKNDILFRAIAICDGYENSSLSEFTTKFVAKVPTVAISNDFTVTITGDNINAPHISKEVYYYQYRLSWAKPYTGSQTSWKSEYIAYDGPFSIDIPQKEKGSWWYLSVKSTREGWDESNETLYEIPVLDSPYFSFDQEQKKLSLSYNNPNAIVYYTLDGSTPTIGSNHYESPIIIDRSHTLKSFAVCDGYIDSPINEQTITFPTPLSFAVEGVTYQLSDSSLVNEVEIINGTKITGDLIVPETVTFDGITYTVIGVGKDAFRANHNISSVILPNTICYIAEGAFCQCSLITEIDIPGSVKSIGYEAFFGTSLKKVVFHEGLQYIGKSAFIGERYNGGPVQIEHAIIFPSTLKYIGGRAFYGNKKIPSITLPEGLEIIEDDAFGGCSLITSISIPSTVKTIRGAFSGCSNIESVEFRGQYCKIDKLYHTFSGCTSLRKIIIPEGVKTLNNTFCGCSALNSISLPSTLKDIDNYVFQNCINLKTIYLPSKLEHIGNAAFYGSGLSSITIPACLSEIGNNVFNDCNNLDSIYCEALTPPTVQGDFGNVTTHTILYVKDIAINNYKKAQYWNDFSSILPYGSSNVKGPTFLFNSDNYTLVISSETEGAKIYYTNDGSTPTEESTLYTEPIPFVRNDTIYAIAVAEGMGSSSVATFMKRDLKVATPVATLSDDLIMTITCEENAPETFPETKIYYQKNKKSNNYEGFSNWILYEGPVQLTEPGHVRTTALRDGWINSEWGQYNFYNGYIFDKPVFEEIQEKKAVVLKHSDPDAKIYYTLDDTKPTKANTLYEDTIHLEHNSVVTAVAAKDRYFNTDTIRREYKWFTAKQPEVTISKNIATITCEEPAEAEIYYTLDNSNPSRESKKYDGPIVLASNCNIKAFAVAENWNDAPVMSYRYRVVEHTCKKPAFSRYANDEEGNLHMTEDSLFITTETEDAIIYYTLNGDKPTERSLRYEGFIKLTGNCTVKAIAVRADLLDSEEAELAIDWFKVETPQIAFEGKLCTITSDSEGATIYYTLDESEPTTRSTFYKGRFALPNQQVIVKAMAVKEDWHDSEIRTRTYNPGGNTCEAPVIARVVGTDSIQMSTRTENTTIYYTLNGLNPTVSDSVYTKPFCLPHNGTLKAMATNPIYYDSEVTSFNVNWYKAAQPVITVEDKVVTMTCATEGAEIHYTLDGSDPTEENAVYRDRITMTGTCTVKAVATYENYNTSTIAKLEYRTSDHACSVPEFTRQGDSISIAATPVENTTIYYTTDGTEPTTSSEIYIRPIKVQENCIIKAIASNPRLFQSEPGSYDVNWFKVDEPVISFDGIYATITCAMPNSKIHYTLDGTTPTEESPLYTGQLTMSSSCNIKAIAMREHFNNSSVVTMAFDKNQNMVGKPQFQRTDSTIVINATPLEGTIIYYTTDGTEPTVTSEVFRDTIRLNGNCVIKALATNPKYFQSEIGTLEVNWFKVETPEITFDGIMAVMNCATPKARIYYTLDGSAPTEESLKYTGAVAMTASCTVKAIAMRSDYNNSAIVSMAFSRDDNTVGKPMFQRTDSTLAISATPAEETIIYYTTDGTEPNTTSKVYTERIRFESNCTVRAMATNPKMFTSPEASYDVDWFNVETPEITFDGIMAAVNCGTPNARIYYTLDGTVPTEESLRYNGNIQMTATCTVKAVGVRSGYNNSAVASVAFNKEENTVTKPIFHKTDSTLRITATPAEGTVIYYTTDGTQPNSASTVYADSVRLEGNCTVKAVAMNPKMFDSETADYEVNWFKVETPEIAFDGIFATIRCTTPAARIYYTTDGSTPTEESTKYSGTLTMTTSCTVKAVAMKEKYNSSAIVAMAFSRDDNTVGKPMFQRTDSTLAISAAPAEGTIIYYTTDGTEPTVASATYTEPLKLNGNCTIRAMAENPKLFQSETADYNVGWFKVETPEILFDGIIANISCATPNARIFYTTDGTTPTEESPRYMGQLTMSQTCTLKALAVKEDYHNSTVSTMLFDREANTVSTPRIRRNGSLLSISTETVAEGTVIYYTTDGTDPTTESTRYTTEITVDENMTVKALAMNEKLFTSGIAIFDVDWFKVATPVLTIDGTTVTANCNTANATLYYAFEEDPTELSKLYTGPIELTDNREVRVIAMRKNYHNSEMASFTPTNFVCQDVTFSYNGRYLQMQAGEGQLIYYTLDGSSPTSEAEIYTDPVDIDMTCTVKAMATRDYWRNSSITAYDVTFVYNGEDVIMEEAGHLEELLNGTGGAQNIESLPVKGKMDSKDLLFIKSMPNLRHLDLTEAVFEGNVLPDEAFAGMSIISFQSPTKITSAGKNLFKGCDQLAAVVWNANVSVPESMVEDVKQNPNFLLYVNSRVYAPSSYKGNLISGGQATSVTLYDTESGGNFCCPQRFYTQQINYTHNYSQQTEKGATRGWETLALPFDVGTITHEKRGSLAPFAKGEDITQYKPFWLYELKETGFTRTSDIKAYTPYIISMPNNPDYADDYILSGKVTFAAKNIYVEADTTHISMKGSVQFAPAMQRQPKGNSVLVINLEDYTAEDETFYPNGSAFLPGLREVHPFESFALTGASARPILLNDYLWEETSDIEQLEMGMLKEIGKNRGVFDLSGRRIVNESMQKNRKQHQRVYIINGKKTLTK